MRNSESIDHRFVTLHALFLPYVVPIITEKINRCFDSLNFSKDELRAVLALVRDRVLAEGGTLAKANAMAKEMGRTIRKLKNTPQKTREEVIEYAADSATAATIIGWITALTNGAPGNLDDERTLDLATLDDAMLPPLDEGTKMFFGLILANTEFEFSDARAVLVAVRKSFPKGQQLPEEAISFLLEDNITVDDGS